MNTADTSDMNIDIMSLQSSEDIASEPLLRGYGFEMFEEYGEITKNKITTYVVLLYSNDSVLNRSKRSLDERKKIAAEMAGFVRDKNGEFGNAVSQNVFYLHDKKIQDIIHNFLRKQPGADALWKEIVTCEQEIDEFQMIRRKPLSDDSDKDYIAATERKNKLAQGVKDRMAMLEKYYRDFYKDHKDIRKAIHQEKINDTLESRAR